MSVLALTPHPDPPPQGGREEDIPRCGEVSDLATRPDRRSPRPEETFGRAFRDGSGDPPRALGMRSTMPTSSWAWHPWHSIRALRLGNMGRLHALTSRPGRSHNNDPFP